MLLAILKFFLSFIAIASLLLLITGIISAINNPQIELDSDGKVVEKGRNARIWFGVITSISWALLIAIL